METSRVLASHTNAMPVCNATATTHPYAGIARAIRTMSPSHSCIMSIQILKNCKNTGTCPTENIPTTSRCTHLHWQRKTPYHSDIDATERAYTGLVSLPYRQLIIMATLLTCHYNKATCGIQVPIYLIDMEGRAKFIAAPFVWY